MKVDNKEKYKVIVGKMNILIILLISSPYQENQ